MNIQLLEYVIGNNFEWCFNDNHWAYSADAKLMRFFLFSQKIHFDSSWELSPIFSRK